MRRLFHGLIFGETVLLAFCSIPLQGECWNARIAPPTDLDPDNLRVSVASQSDRILIGAVSNDLSCPSCPSDNERAAFVYRKNLDQWVLEAELSPPDPTLRKHFGAAVALGVDIAIIGASRDSERAPLAGAVYVFRREGTTWSFDQKLTANDATGSAYFGTSLAGGNNRLLVGASGTGGGVYEFQRTLARWNQVAKIRPPSFGGVGPIDLYIDEFAVGVPTDNIISGCVWCSYGSVFIYRFDGAKWQLQRRLFAEDALLYDRLGSSLSLGKENVLVGLGGDRNAAFNFHYLGWNHIQKFAEQIPYAISCVVQYGSFALVGTSSGVFQLPMDQNNLVGDAPVAMLLGGEAISDIALSDFQAFVATKNGDVYVFDLLDSHCSSDCNADGVDDSVDFYAGVAEYCNATGVLDECKPDCNLNGIPDSCDVWADWIYDCNRNHIVDSCEVENGISPDCSGDGQPDQCDLDCNHNTIPDSCDIHAGTSRDDDADTIPDECESWTKCQVAPGLFDYGPHRANAQAEIMAMLTSGELRAPLDLYERIDGDMRRMESTFPILKTVGRWSEGMTWMYIALDPGDPWTGFDELNAYYQAVSIVPSPYNPYARSISFCDSLNIRALREQYAALPEVTYTEGGVTSTYNYNGDYVTLETHGDVFIYEYANGGGDCPSGCTCEQSWRIATLPSQEIALLSYEPSYCGCDVPNVGDFDGDGLIDCDDPCPAGEAGDDDPDGDGVFDPCDACPETIPGGIADLRGCTPNLGGDVDRDGDIGLDDFKRLSVSMMGPFNPYGCYECIADGDSDVDLRDFAVLQRCSRGEGTPFIYPCE